MKNYFYLFISAFLLIGFASCTKDKCTEHLSYIRFTPVYISPDEYRKDIQLTAPKPLVKPGKIYFYQNYILINEIRKGIHIIDNKDIYNPVNVAFVSIIGNIDMAIMNDKLYADSYTDLLILDFSNPLFPVMMERKLDVFLSPYPIGDLGLLSHYEETEETMSFDCSESGNGSIWFNRGGDIFVIETGQFATNRGAGFSTSLPSNVGIGGSMARFTISKEHLYAIDDSKLYAMRIQAGGMVSDAVETRFPWGIETIFPYQDYIFVGASNGMHILDISNPENPVHVSTFVHANACDPVVVQDDIAFVTLRSGTQCEGFTNQLEVIDVKDVLNPKRLYTFPMDNPHGLAVNGNDLYICEGSYGLKAFDITRLDRIDKNLQSHIKGFHAWDAISLSNQSLLVIGEDGFRQYDNSDATNLKLLSLIPVQK
jgi:hypothetical protein